MSTCRTCKYREELPGDAHIACAKAFDASKPLAAISQILGSVGRVPLPDGNTPVNFRPELKRWPGCGAWPACFDENIVVSCAGYEAHDH